MNLLAQSKHELFKEIDPKILAGICRGLEKEGLRVSPTTGVLAKTPHPKSLGSALTHPSITTDYSESLLELITPVSNCIETSLEQLSATHRFVASQLERELMWSASMPCIITDENDIPIASYGNSNVGTMKRVYRNGLAVRYGRIMQSIAGIHYNFSMPDPFWQASWEQAGKPGSQQTFKNKGYLGLIRNFFEYSWLLIYLLGASPAVCSSFLSRHCNHQLEPFDTLNTSFHLPYATSLRMGDLGYTSSTQSNLHICYNHLDGYIQTLRQAILTSHPKYSQYAMRTNGELTQLNDSLLQIENEFYSPIRPKRVSQSNEAPLVALQRAGIEYIELRCIDINPFLPLGIDAQTIRLIDIFLVNALLSKSPKFGEQDYYRHKENLRRVVEQGRNQKTTLLTRNKELPLTELANQALDQMAETADLLNKANGNNAYTDALTMAQTRVAYPDLTPSGRILREMKEDNIAFWQLILKYSNQWHQQFLADPPCDTAMMEFQTTAAMSLREQIKLEAETNETFDTYLARFFNQYHGIKL